MTNHKLTDKICLIITALMLVVVVLFMNGSALGLQVKENTIGYEDRLFDTSKVHTIDIIMDDWNSFIENATNEEYRSCDIVIDGEKSKAVGIRAKGNTSLSQVAQYGNNRYSFKIEFDKYQKHNSYYGLDKFVLNNSIMDNTYMKDYLAYNMMSWAGANSPLCSYSFITVNGEDWGLYVAVEGIEDSFLERNYDSKDGELYKPDSSQLGGGRGNGKDFHMDEESDNSEGSDNSTENNIPQGNRDSNNGAPPNMNSLDNMQGQQQGPPNSANNQDSIPSLPQNSSDADNKNTDSMVPNQSQQGANAPMGGGMNGSPNGVENGSDDVKLIYTDDNYDSYSNIFDNAKEKLTNKDKDRLISSLKDLNAQSNIENVVNVDEVINYFVAHNFIVNGDSYTGSMIHNYYLYEENGLLSMLPWDYNLGFGTFQGQNASNAINFAIDTPTSSGSYDTLPMLKWILDNDEYKDKYHQSFSKFIETYFTSGYCEQFIEDTEELIAPYVQRETKGFCSYSDFETGVSVLKQFCSLRSQSIIGQLDGSIPSTTQEQSADSSSLIDTTNINLNLMGSMGGGMGGNQHNGDNLGRFPPQMGSSDESSDTSNRQMQPPSMNGSDNNMSPPQMPNGNNGQFSPPNVPNGENGQQQAPQPNSDSDNGEQNNSNLPGGTTGKDNQSAMQGNKNGLPGADKGANNQEKAPNANQQNNSQVSNNLNSQSLIWLAVSVLVLGIGIVVAIKTKHN